MLFVTTDLKEFSLHVGQKMPHIYPDYEKVKWIKADGDELNYITIKFDNLPRRLGVNVVKYFGETAEFIVHNW